MIDCQRAFKWGIKIVNKVVKNSDNSFCAHGYAGYFLGDKATVYMVFVFFLIMILCGLVLCIKYVR